MDAPIVIDLTVDEVPEVATRAEPAVLRKIPEVIDLTEEVTKSPEMVQAQEVTEPNGMMQEVAEYTGIIKEVSETTGMIQEVIEPNEMVQVQKVAEPTEMVQIQKVAEPTEMVQIQKVAEPTVMVQVQEIAEPTVMVQVQEIAEPTEMVQVQEIAEPTEMVQVQEIAEPTEMVQVQEIAEPTEMVQVQEIAEPTEMVQVQEIAEPTEMVQVQEVAEPTELVQVQEITEPIKMVQEITESTGMVQVQEVIEPTKIVQVQELAEATGMVQELAEATGMVQEVAEPTDVGDITTKVINMVISEVVEIVAADCSELDKIMPVKMFQEKDVITPTEVTDIPAVTKSDRKSTPVEEIERMKLPDLSSEPGTSNSSVIYQGDSQRGRHQQKGFYSPYIYKVFQKRHPGYEISGELVRIIDDVLNNLLDKVFVKASRLSRKRRKDILTSQDIQAAVFLSLPHKMARQAASEAIKAVESYIRTMDP